MAQVILIRFKKSERVSSIGNRVTENMRTRSSFLTMTIPAIYSTRIAEIITAADSKLKLSLIAPQALFPVLKELDGQGQSSHLLEPSKLLYIPAGHCVQADAPGGAYVPAEQMVEQG